MYHTKLHPFGRYHVLSTIIASFRIEASGKRDHRISSLVQIVGTSIILIYATFCSFCVTMETILEGNI